MIDLRFTGTEIWGWIVGLWRVVRSRGKSLEQQLAEREKEVDKLRQAINAQHQHPSRTVSTREFEEERGALFKRRPEGGYHDAVYCPKCQLSTVAASERHVYRCPICGWQATFGRSSRHGVIADLVARDAAKK